MFVVDKNEWKDGKITLRSENPNYKNFDYVASGQMAAFSNTEWEFNGYTYTPLPDYAETREWFPTSYSFQATSPHKIAHNSEEWFCELLSSIFWTL